MGIGRDISFCCDRDHTSYLIIYNRLTSYLAVPQVRLSLNERCKKQRILKTCRRKCTERKQRSDRRGNARRAVSVDISCQLEDTRAFQFAIRIDSFCKKNRPFDSLVVMQFLHEINNTNTFNTVIFN